MRQKVWRRESPSGCNRPHMRPMWSASAKPNLFTLKHNALLNCYVRAPTCLASWDENDWIDCHASVSCRSGQSQISPSSGKTLQMTSCWIRTYALVHNHSKGSIACIGSHSFKSNRLNKGMLDLIGCKALCLIKGSKSMYSFYTPKDLISPTESQMVEQKPRKTPSNRTDGEGHWKPEHSINGEQV